jgi:hypothetical protein
MWIDDTRYGYVHAAWDERFVMDGFGNAVPVAWYQAPFYFMGEH